MISITFHDEDSWEHRTPLWSLRPRRGAFSWEQALAKMLEERQAHTHYRMVVFSGAQLRAPRTGWSDMLCLGWGAAHAYTIARAKDDRFQSWEVNYHYVLVNADRQQLTVTMNRLDLTSGKAVWTQPDSVKIATPPSALVQGTSH